MDQAVSLEWFFAHLYEEALCFIESSSLRSYEERRVARLDPYHIDMTIDILSCHSEIRKINSQSGEKFGSNMIDGGNGFHKKKLVVWSVIIMSVSVSRWSCMGFDATVFAKHRIPEWFDEDLDNRIDRGDYNQKNKIYQSYKDKNSI